GIDRRAPTHVPGFLLPRALPADRKCCCVRRSRPRPGLPPVDRRIGAPSHRSARVERCVRADLFPEPDRRRPELPIAAQRVRQRSVLLAAARSERRPSALLTPARRRDLSLPEAGVAGGEDRAAGLAVLGGSA